MLRRAALLPLLALVSLALLCIPCVSSQCTFGLFLLDRAVLDLDERILYARQCGMQGCDYNCVAEEGRLCDFYPLCNRTTQLTYTRSAQAFFLGQSSFLAINRLGPTRFFLS